MVKFIYMYEIYKVSHILRISISWVDALVIVKSNANSLPQSIYIERSFRAHVTSSLINDVPVEYSILSRYE